MRFNKNILGLILGPLLFLAIMIFVDAEGLSFEAKCILASTAWMAVWWVTECVPISVTHQTAIHTVEASIHFASKLNPSACTKISIIEKSNGPKINPKIFLFNLILIEH